MDITTLLSQLSPAAQGIVQNMDPQTQQEVLALASAQGVAAVEDALRQFAMSQGIPYDQINAQAGGTGAPPPADPSMAPPPGAPPMAAAPPAGMAPPPDAGGPPVSPPMDPQVAAAAAQVSGGAAGGPPPPAQVPPDAMNTPANGAPQPDAQQLLKGDPKQPYYEEEPDDWEPPAQPQSRWKDKKPTIQRVLEDAETGRSVWASRDLRIALDTSMYHQEYGLGEDASDDGDDVLLEDGSLFHRSANPTGLVNRTTGIIAATQDRVTRHTPRRHESQPYVDAAQKLEDFMRACRMREEQEWFERGSRIGDPQPPLPYTEAGLSALEGGFGWKWDVDISDKDSPFKYEAVPLSQLYPLGHATTRQWTLPLELARGQYEEIDEAFPLDDERAKSYYESMDIDFVEWADNAGYWYCVAYKESSLRSSKAQKDGWVIPPRKVGYGFPYFNYVIWGGSPTRPNSYNRRTHTANVGYGILTPLRKTYRLMDIMVSAIATGALKMQTPAVARTVLEGRSMEKVTPLDYSPGAENKMRPGEDVKPLVFDIAATQAGVAFIQALGQELQNNIPPMLAGMTASSGFEYMQRSDDAHSLIIKPMIDAMQRSYELQDRQRAILAYRFARRGKGEGKDLKDKQYFSEYNYVGTDKRGYSYTGKLKVADLKKSGCYTSIRYTEKSLTEQIQIASLVTQLVNAHLMSQEQALIKLGNDDPGKELKKIFEDAALMQPEFLKAQTEMAVVNSGSPALIQGWIRAFGAAPGGTPPAPQGQPSMAAQPGGQSQGLPNEVAQPTAQANGMMTG